jgi:hypothetical protein
MGISQLLHLPAWGVIMPLGPVSCIISIISMMLLPVRGGGTNTCPIAVKGRQCHGHLPSNDSVVCPELAACPQWEQRHA